MKKLAIFTLTTLASSIALATQLANPDKIEPLKSFSPPKPISPNIAQRNMLENQFDRTERTHYYSVTDKINGGISPLKFSSGFYGKSTYSSLLSGFRQANYYGIFNINYTKANRYKDGQGNKINFGYERFNQGAVIGWVPNDKQEYRLTFIHDDIDDDKQPQHQMDPINTERFVTKLNARYGLEDLSNTLNTEISYRHIKRHVDNYRLRNSVQNVHIQLDRDILDLNLKYDVDINQWHNLLGLSYQYDKHNGERYLHTGKKEILNGYRFGDIHTHQYRIFDNLSYTFNPQHKLGLGLSYEINRAEIKKYNAKLINPMNPKLQFANPLQLWGYNFGYKGNGIIHQHGLSTELEYNYTPTDLQSYSINVAHIERIGNNEERFNSVASILYNASNKTFINQNPASAIIGNPELKPEQHNYVKFSFDLKNNFYKGYLNSIMGKGINIGGDITFDKVRNLIIFDRTFSRLPNGTINNGIITRNVNANLFSANFYANYNFLQNWAIALKTRYTYGHNTTEHRPLYQIRPFELTTNLDYKNYFSYGSYNFGVALRHVAKQHRGDFDKTKGLGIDNHIAAKSITLTDLYAGINIKDQFGVRMGVNNLFNRHYAEFISGDHVVALSPNLVYAPGRTFWLSLHTSF